MEELGILYVLSTDTVFFTNADQRLHAEEQGAFLTKNSLEGYKKYKYVYMLSYFVREGGYIFKSHGDLCAIWKWQQSSCTFLTWEDSYPAMFLI